MLAAAVAWWLLCGCSEPKRTASTPDDTIGVQPIYQFAISSDSQLLATFEMQRTIRIEDLATRRTLHLLEYGNRWPVSVAFCSAGKALLAVYRDGSVVLWNGITGDKPRRNRIASISGDANVACCWNGRRIAAADRHSVLSIWDGDSLLWRRKLPAEGSISHLSFSPDGGNVLSCGMSSGVRVWSVETGEWTTLAGSSGLRVRSARFSPDGRRIVTAGFDGWLREWSVRSGLQLWSRQLAELPLTAVRYTPDGRSVVVATVPGPYYNGEVVLCGTSSPQTTCVISTLASSVTQLEFTPDGVLHISTQGGEFISLRLDEERNCK
jgi:cytochrome c